MKKCIFYPNEEELAQDGPFCACGSDVSGATPYCTEEDENNCQWAKEEKQRRVKCK